MSLTLPHPKPIRVGQNTFATNTVDTRIPKILRDVIKTNPDFTTEIVQSVEQLAVDLEQGNPIRLPNPLLGDDYESWAQEYAWQASLTDVLTWHDCEWFFAETYLYRCLMERVRWFETNRDPFAPAKQQEFDNPRLWQLLEQTQSLEGSIGEKWSALLGYDLWGNRVDLSHSASQKIGGNDAVDSDLLVDDRSQVIDHLLESRKHQPIVYMVCDNAGVELALDLALVDDLLAGGIAQIVLHLKAHPTFVSDALPHDVWQLIDAMERHGGSTHQLATRLRAYWAEERLRFVPHDCWNSSSFLCDMSLTHLFTDATLVIFKGDANYRRVVGDALWNPETPFAEVVSYFHAPLLMLRTLKSDSVVGLPEGLAQQLDTIDSEWRVNGQRGVIQFAPAKPSAKPN